MSGRNLTLTPKFQPSELNTKLIQIAEAIQLLSDVGVLDLSGGGTGFSSYTLGDLLYGNASTALAKLAGNITTARQFLRQTGTGSISAPPVWDTLVAGDIPSLDASKITTGLLALARGGTHVDLSASGGTGQVLKQTSAGADISVATLAPSELNVAKTDVTYSAGNFTTSSGTWTVDSGDQKTYSYVIFGSKLMLLVVRLDSTTTATTPGELRVAIPTGATAAVASNDPFIFTTDGFVTYATGIAACQAGNAYVQLFYTNLAAWPNATNNVNVSFTKWIWLS